MPENQGKIEKVINLCSRRGLVFQNSELYAPLGGFFDYAHYGVALKRKIAQSWWDFFVKQREDVVGLDGAIISSSKVWRASGHLENFVDPLVECEKCRSQFRADQLLQDELKLDVEGLDKQKLAGLVKEHKLKCEKCKGNLAEVSSFNLMFKTNVGPEDTVNVLTCKKCSWPIPFIPVRKEGKWGLQQLPTIACSKGGDHDCTGSPTYSFTVPREPVYLRPETAQTIFSDFKTIASFARKKLPFGIAQIGKAFRNEISPRNFLFRAREFEQMELEFFLHPDKKPDFEKTRLNLKVKVLTAKEQAGKTPKLVEKTIGDLLKEKTVSTEWLGYWMGETLYWLESIGLKKENLRIRQHVPTELSHYSKETWDVEYDYPEWGWKELVGVADRGDFDLTQHQAHSKKDQSVFDEETKKKILPRVVEPSFGLDRLFFTLLVDAYAEEGEKTMLKLDSSIAPLKCAVFPLMAKDGLDGKARGVFDNLKKEGFDAEYDEAGSIGKRYARMDEVGTPYCITVDYDSLKDDDCTVRYRDSGEQKRVKLSKLSAELKKA